MKNKKPSMESALKTYWSRIADYEATRTDSPWDWHLQAWAADQVAVAREEAFSAAERLNIKAKMEKADARRKAIMAVCSETGEDELYWMKRKRVPFTQDGK